MNGIRSRYEELLSKANLSFIAEVLLCNREFEGETEQSLIDTEEKMLENISKLSEQLSQNDNEKIMLDVIDYGVAIEKRYFWYGLCCGGKLLTELKG